MKKITVFLVAAASFILSTVITVSVKSHSSAVDGRGPVVWLHLMPVANAQQAIVCRATAVYQCRDGAWVDYNDAWGRGFTEVAARNNLAQSGVASGPVACRQNGGWTGRYQWTSSMSCRR